MATNIDNFLAGIPDEEEATAAAIPTLKQGELAFDPTGGEGGIPTLTVGGGEPILEGLLPGTAALKKKVEEETPQEKILRGRSGRALPTLESEIDPVTGETILTAGPPPQERPTGPLAGVQAGALVGTFGILESFGIPTRALGATVREKNPFASKSDKGKTWDEVFADPNSGIFKEARRVVRSSDLPGAVKFILEMGISLPEDPLAIVTGLIGAGRAAATRVGARRAAQKAETDIARRFISDPSKPDVLLPSGKVDQVFTPAEREFISTGIVSKETAKAERAAIKNAPEVKRELDAGRTENIVNSIQDIRAKHGLTDTGEGGVLFAKVEGSIDDAVSLYKKEVNELYRGINTKADPSIIGAETKQVVKERFEKLGIKPAQTKIELQALSERLVREAQKNGVLDFRNGLPFNKQTGQFLDVKSLKIPALGASDLGISPTAFTLLNKVKISLQRDVTLKVLRKNKTTIQSQIQVARRAGDDGTVAVLEQARDALKEATRTQLDDVLGDPALTREWMLADDFITQNTAGVKAAGNLMFDRAGNPRSTSAIIREFNKVPVRKKGAVIDKMMDFFDEEALVNLRNLYFNDIIEQASTKGFTGQKLRNAINAQPETVFNKVFTQEMKQDMSQLLGDAISDDLAKQLTRAKLGTFAAADKQTLIKTIFSNPAYRIWAATAGFTKASLKRLSLIGAAQVALGIAEKKAVRSAASFLKGTNKQGLTGLTFKSLREGAAGARSLVVPTIIQRRATEALRTDTVTEDAGVSDSEIDDFLKGL